MSVKSAMEELGWFTAALLLLLCLTAAVLFMACVVILGVAATRNALELL